MNSQWSRGHPRSKSSFFRLRRIRIGIGIIFGLVFLSYFQRRVDVGEKELRRLARQGTHEEFVSSLHGDHNSVKGEDSHGSEIKRGMVQLRLEDVLVVAGYKIEQLSGLPREALEVLYKAVMLGIQKPKNPSICTERPDGLDETDSSPSIHADNTSPTPDLNPHNQSLENNASTKHNRVRFRDSTMDLQDCQLFVKSLSVVSPFDASTAVRSAYRAGGNLVPKVAFLFLVRGPMPFIQVWQRFFEGKEGKYSIYVHATPGFSYKEKDFLFYGKQVRSRRVYWGTISVVDAFRRLLANALLDPMNARFMVVSESDIPIRSFDFIYDYLMGARESFIGGPHRCIREKNLGLIVVGRAIMKYWKHGEAWFEVKRKHARILVEDWKYFEMGLQYCKLTNSPTCVLDENLLQTILAIKDGAHVANRTVMSVDWPTTGAHPKTYFDEDITDALFRELQSEDSDEKHRNIVMETKECYRNGKRAPCWLFARKFYRRSQSKILSMSNSTLGY